MEQPKRKRGRPRKNPLPLEIQEVIKEVEKKKEETIPEPVHENNEEVIVSDLSFKWDVPLGLKIEYFDSNLSYELTGYRPINAFKSLDFDPSWFTETRDVFLRTGNYTEYKKDSKGFREFWIEQYKRCKYGMTVNGYTITGDHYYFLNFYQLKDNINVSEAGMGRNLIFPNFMEGQYLWFHYLLLAKRLKLNACMMKAREAGK